MYRLLGALVSRYWLLIVLGWILLAWGIRSVAPEWNTVTNDGDLDYMPARMTSVRGEQLMSEAFPEKRARSQIALVLERPDGVLTKSDLSVAAQLAEDVPRFIAERFAAQNLGPSPVVDVWTPSTEIVGEKLVSDDRQAALVAVLLSNEFMSLSNMQVLDATLAALEDARQSDDYPGGLTLGVTGSAAIGGDMLNSAAESISNTHTATIGMVLIILLLVYRAPVLVCITLGTIVTSVIVATNLVAILTQVHKVPGLHWVEFNIFKTTEIFIITILFGSGTDFCLFLVSRYREELEKGLDKAQAVAAALAGVGDALVASALTTVCGLGMMFFADFGKFRNSGPSIGLCLLVALAACMTLAPALLRLFGSLVFWPFGVGKKSSTADEAGANLGQREFFGRFWNWVAGQIVARPGLIMIVCLMVMAPLAYHGGFADPFLALAGSDRQSITISYDLVAELQEDRPSVQGTNMVRRHFLPGEVGPVTILVHRSVASFDVALRRQIAAASFRSEQSEALRKEVAGELVTEQQWQELLAELPRDSDHWSKIATLAFSPDSEEFRRLIAALPLDSNIWKLGIPLDNSVREQIADLTSDNKLLQQMVAGEAVDADAWRRYLARLPSNSTHWWAVAEALPPGSKPREQLEIVQSFGIAALTKTLYDVPGVADVRSIAEPLGGAPGLANPLSPAGLKRVTARRHPRAQAIFFTQVPDLKGTVTRMDAILQPDPFSRAAQDLLGTIDDKLAGFSSNPDSPWYGTHFDFVGTTAVTRDLSKVTTSDQKLIQVLVVLAVLAILLVILRRPLISVYLILSVLLSYFVTIGATQLVFGYIYPDFEGLDWKVPIFLFVILVAVGEDYNIYLVTRVFEEQRHYGAMEGLRRAVAQTGGIITSCGVIMAGTFVSMCTGTLRAIVELGFALTLGVVLDTFVVRPILVPAFLALLYRMSKTAEQPSPPESAVPVNKAATPSPHSGKVQHTSRR